MIQIILKVITLLLILIFLLLGLSAYIDPVTFLEKDPFAWSPDGIAGLSAGRAVIGGHFLGLALVAIYGFIKSKYQLFYVIAISEFMIALGRLLSLVVDGFDQRVVIPLVVELLMAIIMFCAAKFLLPKQATPAA